MTSGARQPEAAPQRPMAWTAEANAVESPLRHHLNNEREFGFAPSSLFSVFRPEWLICGSWDRRDRERRRLCLLFGLSGKKSVGGDPICSPLNLNRKIPVTVSRRSTGNRESKGFVF